MKRYEKFNFGVMVAFDRTVKWAMKTGEAVDFKCGWVPDVPCEQCPLNAMREECYDKRTAKEWLDWLFEDVEEDTEEGTEEDAEEEGNVQDETD